MCRNKKLNQNFIQSISSIDHIYIILAEDTVHANVIVIIRITFMQIKTLFITFMSLKYCSRQRVFSHVMTLQPALLYISSLPPYCAARYGPNTHLRWEMCSRTTSTCRCLFEWNHQWPWLVYRRSQDRVWERLQIYRIHICMYDHWCINLQRKKKPLSTVVF